MDESFTPQPGDLQVAKHLQLVELSKKVFATVEAFSDELENIDGVGITNNPITVDSGKTKSIFRCIGSDGQFYLFIRLPDNTVQFIGVVEALKDVASFVTLKGKDFLDK